MNRKSPPRFLIALALVLPLAACTAPAVTVKGAWNDGAARNQVFRKLLVVGVSPDLNQRCAFERSLVSDLRGPGVEAIASCSEIPADTPLSRAAVEQAVKKNGADAVLATLLVASDLKTKEGATRDAKGAGIYKPVAYGYSTTGYYDTYGRGYDAYGIPVVYAEFETLPSVFTLAGSAVLQTNIYETRNATVVYAFNTEAHDLQSREMGLALVTPAIAARLRKDGVIP